MATIRDFKIAAAALDDGVGEVFIKGAAKNNVDENTAIELFDLIEKLSGYGFNKSHAAAYSYIGFQTAYLKNYYPEIFHKVMMHEITECNQLFKRNIEKGIEQGLYRKSLNIEYYAQFYYHLIFSIKENTSSEKEAHKLELEILEYHTRAIATPTGKNELEKNLLNTKIQ